MPPLTFSDWLAVSYTGETEQQDLNAHKRHIGLPEGVAPAPNPSHIATFHKHLKSLSQDELQHYAKPLAPEHRSATGTELIHHILRHTFDDKPSRKPSHIDNYLKTINEEDAAATLDSNPVDGLLNENEPLKVGQKIHFGDLQKMGYKHYRNRGIHSMEYRHPEHGALIIHRNSWKSDMPRPTHGVIHSIQSNVGRSNNPGDIGRRRRFIKLDPGSYD